MKTFALIFLLNLNFICSTKAVKIDSFNFTNRTKPALPYYVIPEPSVIEFGKYLKEIYRFCSDLMN